MIRNSRSIAGSIVALQILFVVSSFAQGAGSQKIFGDVTSTVTTLRNSSAVLIGGQGGWMVSRTLALGIEGFTLVNNVESRVPDTLGDRSLTFNYGGVTFGYVLPFAGSYDAVFQALVGGGSISHKETPYRDRRQYHDPFLVIEPRVMVETPISKVFRLGIGASYRRIALLTSSLATQSELSGISATVSLKVGFF